MHQLYYWRAQLLWGLLLIALGVLFALDRLDLVLADGLWRYWPFLCVLFGINKLIGAPRAGDVLSGLWLVFFGLWFYASFEHLWGLHFGNSWPFLIIASGLGMVLRPLLAKAYAAKQGVQQ